MSKLSEALKTLIHAPHASPGPVPASKQVSAVYDQIAQDASSKGVGLPAWLSFSTATTMTMNSPDSLLALYQSATAAREKAKKIFAAELMREVGLKCISFNGIPRTINCLGAFHAGIPTEISSALSRTPTRSLARSNADSTRARGLSLWKSIYHPLDTKLTDKLSQSHPDLPVHIHEAHYGMLLSSPESSTGSDVRHPRVGRVLTSIVAIAALRAQTGVGPQVLSHIFGLRKAYADGTHQAAGEEVVDGGEWLASDEGSTWLLESIDSIVRAISGGKGTTFAPRLRAKL